jgi:RNA polymerase sigma-70 factor, ECF subfamily
MDRAEQRELHALVVRLASGDRGAFRPVFDRVRPMIERFALRALPNRADAEDVAQQALMKLFSRASEFDPDRDAVSWILGIAAYEVKTARKKRVRSKEELGASGLEEISNPAPTPEAQLIDRDLLGALTEVLGAMRTEDAEAILASASIIERPAIAPATFRKRLQRAMVRFKAAWGATKHGP